MGIPGNLQLLGPSANTHDSFTSLTVREGFNARPQERVYRLGIDASISLLQSHGLVGNTSPSTTSLVSPAYGHDAAVPIEQIPLASRGIFTLPSGEEIVFDKRIPLRDPPAVHYSSRIDQLFFDWHNSDLVRINGRGVPIKCWDGLITFCSTSSLTFPQFIVEEKERLGSGAASLQHERKARDKQAFADALSCFGGDLDSPLAKGAFRYTKGGITQVSRRPDTVAKIWRRLLDEDAEVAGHWRHLQDLYRVD